MVSDELDQLARLLAPSTICLQDEGEELRMVSNGTGLVLPALAAFHRGSCAQRALRGTGPVRVTRRVNDRDIHVPDNRAERELDVCMLIISVPELKARHGIIFKGVPHLYSEGGTSDNVTGRGASQTYSGKYTSGYNHGRVLPGIALEGGLPTTS